MEAVADILQAASRDMRGECSLKMKPTDRLEGTVEIKVRCLWLCATRGGGLMRALVPSSLKIKYILKDFCTVMNISEGKCMAARIDMIVGVNHAFKRRNYHENGENFDSHQSANLWDTPGVKYFNGECTVAETGLKDANDILDIIYSPVGNETKLDFYEPFGSDRGL